MQARYSHFASPEVCVLTLGLQLALHCDALYIRAFWKWALLSARGVLRICGPVPVSVSRYHIRPGRVLIRDIGRVWWQTCVAWLDVKTQAFAPVAEMLDGHAPGDTRGHEDNAKRAMALKMFDGTEFRAVHDFLHVEEEEFDPSRKGKGRAKQSDGEM